MCIFDLFSNLLFLPWKFLFTGLQLSTGYSVDYDLMKRVSVELNNVEKEVDNIRQSNTDEANKVSAALLIIGDEIADSFLTP